MLLLRDVRVEAMRQPRHSALKRRVKFAGDHALAPVLLAQHAQGVSIISGDPLLRDVAERDIISSHLVLYR